MELIYILLCTLPWMWTSSAQGVRRSELPPGNLGRPYENDTSLTMDEIITGAVGGVGVASNMLLADDDKILAELDMYLTKKQFLSMYEPPTPYETSGDNNSDPLTKSNNYLFDFAEDYKGSGIRTKRKAAIETRLRWTKGEIPYLFAKSHFNKMEEYMMRRSMTEWERYTCLKFKPANNTDKNSVRFQNGVGCNSQLGMVGGIQSLNLQTPGCRYKGLYLHEIGHAIGLVHEHQLPDRDQYISILYHNVDPIMRVWFNKYTSNEVNQMGVPYEYSSVMHYGITAFAFDGQSQTIQAHDKSKEETIGKVYLKELAYTDVHIVNLMYGCSSHCTNQNQCGSDGHLDQNCKCICRDGSSDCDRTKAKISGTCVNNYDSWACYIWANQGECERNPLYMSQQCAKACGICGSVSNNQGGCKDVYEKTKCKVWMERGDCITNDRWMKLNCKATCNLCGGAATTGLTNCANTHEDSNKCDNWAKDGECSVNAQWMFSNCRKSCGMCSQESIDEGEDNEGVDEDKMACENTNSNCESWAQNEQCESNSNWMISNCRQACNKCDDGTCKNLFEDVQCEIWAQKLECLTNSIWMAKHCARACGRGVCEKVVPTVHNLQTTTSMTSRRTTTKSTVVTTASCKNTHSSDIECDIWSKSGHCSINPGWMLIYCAKSCNVCSTGGRATTTSRTSTGTDNICDDVDTKCVGWAKSGYCNSNPQYNLKYCKKSCNNCNGCRDTNSLCGIWAKDMQCQKNPRYMLRNCQRSCNTCSMASDELVHRPENGSSNHIMGVQLLISSVLCYIVVLFMP